MSFPSPFAKTRCWAICAIYFVLGTFAGVTVGQEDAKKPSKPDFVDGPWITALDLGPGADDIIAGSATGLLLRSGSVHRSRVGAIEQLNESLTTATSVWAVRLMMDGSTLVATEYNGDVTIAKLGEPESGRKLPSKLKWIRCLVELDNTTVLAGTEDGKLVKINTASATVGDPVDAHAAQIFSINTSPKHGKLVTSSGDGTIKLWNSQSMQLEREIRVSSEPIWSAILSENGRWIVTGGADRRINLYDAATGVLQMSLAVTREWVSQLTQLPGDVVAASCLDGSIYFVDIEARLPVTVVSAAKSGIWSMALCQDKNHLIVGTRKHGLAIVSSDVWTAAAAATKVRATEEQPPAPASKN